MSAEEYFSKSGLSDSGMRELMVSPLRYWHLCVNPNRPKIEPTPAMVIGSALHCAVLEGDAVFESRYARQVNPAEHDGLLETIGDIRDWCRDRGKPAKGTLKEDVVKWALSIDPSVPILQEIERRHFADNQGKEILSLEFWDLVTGMVESLREEPRVQEIISHGSPEVPYFAVDPDTGVNLKARMDWVAPAMIMDIKTFSQTRGKSIDRCVNDAIFYEQYYRKAYFYSMLRALAEGDSWTKQKTEFILVFVESSPPHEVRIKSLRPKFAGNINLYWERGRIEVTDCIRRYKECMAHFGDKPWKYAQEIETLQDEELPQSLNY